LFWLRKPSEIKFELHYFLRTLILFKIISCQLKWYIYEEKYYLLIIKLLKFCWSYKSNECYSFYTRLFVIHLHI